MNSSLQLMTLKRAAHSVMFLSSSDSWLISLTINLFTYATVAIPAYLLIKYITNKYGATADADVSGVVDRWLTRLLILFAIGRPNCKETLLISNSELGITVQRQRRRVEGWQRMLLLLFFFASLLTFYVSWGWFQEALMTLPYKKSNGITMDKFKDAQFLVFLNRLSAFLLSGIYILINWKDQPTHTAPLYMYSFASFSNIMSSWCQYEALKYVTFPTQTISKASKIIPVMIMGKLVSGNKYPTHQYITATMLACGVSLFLLSSDSDKHQKASAVEATSFSGIVLMIGYLAFDSFTPNWQSKLYNYDPRVSSFQMMCGVNLFSAGLTLISLIEQSSLLSSLEFIIRHDRVLRDCILLSMFGSIGQIFIYKTIDHFGAVIFTIIMTVRQMVSIVVSCLYYGHEISPIGLLGLVIAFASLFLNHYLKQKKQKTIDGGGR